MKPTQESRNQRRRWERVATASDRLAHNIREFDTPTDEEFLDNLEAAISEAVGAKRDESQRALERLVAGRKGCHANYNGGWLGRDTNKAFHHGMDTVFNIIDDAAQMKGQEKLAHNHPRLVAFLYLLARDHLALGAVECIMQDHVALAGARTCSNEHLAAYAQELADRLTGGDHD